MLDIPKELQKKRKKKKEPQSNKLPAKKYASCLSIRNLVLKIRKAYSQLQECGQIPVLEPIPPKA
jgi:hypothetical protein